MWAAINLACDRQAMFSEDRVGANALCRGKKKKDKDAEATFIYIFFYLYNASFYHALYVQLNEYASACSCLNPPTPPIANLQTWQADVNAQEWDVLRRKGFWSAMQIWGQVPCLWRNMFYI